MGLNIINSDKMVGIYFCGNRFMCVNVYFSIKEWKFEFLDNENYSKYVIVEINRNGHWNAIDQKNFYNLNYPNMKATHQISADWFADFNNAMFTFEEALKESK